MLTEDEIRKGFKNVEKDFDGLTEVIDKMIKMDAILLKRIMRLEGAVRELRRLACADLQVGAQGELK